MFDVTLGTYIRYLLENPLNYLFLPLNLLCFVAAELAMTFYLRFLAEYEKVKEGRSEYFGGRVEMFWGMLGVVVCCYLVILVAKYFCFYVMVLNSNQSIHDKMLRGIVRSPAFFFDITPSGLLINKFSNDLGALDSTLSYLMVFTFDGLIAIIVALINICQIYVYLIPLVVAFMVLAILFFNYCRPAIIACKQLDLKNKAPIFHSFT